MADSKASGDRDETNKKTPTSSRKRNVWNPAEEKQVLIICQQLQIAEQLDSCVTSAGNEGVYSNICEGLVEAGFEERDLNKVREKYRKLKSKYHDVRLHNLTATGRGRKIWHLYDLADSVWGHRPVAAKKTIDTDIDVPTFSDEKENSDGAKEENGSEEKEDEEQPQKKQKRDSKVVVKFKRGSGSGVRGSRRELKSIADSDNYFVQKMVEIEEKRMENELKLQRERLEAEKANRDAQMKFQQDLMYMMLQMQQPQSTHLSPQSLYGPAQFTPERDGHRPNFEVPDDKQPGSFGRNLMYDFR